MKKIFVSSTVWDMPDVRAELYEYLSRNGFQPLMSDSPDFGEDSKLESSYKKCHNVLKECDAFLLIINSRYGGKKEYKEGEISITHQEFRWALEENKDFICFIRERAVTDYDIWKRSGRSNSAVTSFIQSGKDFKIFEFIDDIYRSAPGGGALWWRPFKDSVDLKKQLTTKLGIDDYSNNYLAQAQALHALPKLVINIIAGSMSGTTIINNTIINNVGSGTAADIRIILWEGTHKLKEYFFKAIPANESVKINFEFILPGALVLGNKIVNVQIGYKNIIGNSFETEYIFNFENHKYVPIHEEIYYGAPR